jgi:small subunit ribosomal protein S15
MATFNNKHHDLIQNNHFWRYFMARMHARRKGKSSSTRPYHSSIPEWIPIKGSEIEDIIVKLNKEGLSTSEIGLRLRDQYSVPCVKTSTGKKITKILNENKIKFKLPEDLSNLLRKVHNLDVHMKKNPKDLGNWRSMKLLEAKIRRLARYYKTRKELPDDWKYNLASVKLILD